MNNELIEKIKAAKSAEEVIEIARKELSFEDTANVAGGTGRVEMTEAQAERVVGGGHYITDKLGDKIWISLIDDGYKPGPDTDPLYDRAYAMEVMATSGFTMDVLIKVGNELFPFSSYTIDVEKALRAGGPVYLADCVRSANGFHF